jgi:hypothetical protein
MLLRAILVLPACKFCENVTQYKLLSEVGYRGEIPQHGYSYAETQPLS